MSGTVGRLDAALRQDQQQTLTQCGGAQEHLTAGSAGKQATRKTEGSRWEPVACAVHLPCGVAVVDRLFHHGSPGAAYDQRVFGCGRVERPRRFGDVRRPRRSGAADLDVWRGVRL
jgi:hypothetical protein